eukprot:1982002-Amphidinium_carterae.1
MMHVFGNHQTSSHIPSCACHGRAYTTWTRNFESQAGVAQTRVTRTQVLLKVTSNVWDKVDINTQTNTQSSYRANRVRHCFKNGVVPCNVLWELRSSRAQVLVQDQIDKIAFDPRT